MRRISGSLPWCGVLVGGGALAPQVRYQGRVPNKGYREVPVVPDRLKDAMAYFGADTQNVSPDDPPFIPEEQRQNVTKEIMTSNQNLKNHSKLDRLRASLDAVHNQPPESDKWAEAYLFLRTTELCCELQRDRTDVFPKGKKLWVEMEFCEEKRQPVLLELSNGMIVMPVFSMEEYLDHYFSRVEAFESCWFPVPRGGSRYDEFCSMPFPVCAIGGLNHLCTLATVSMATGQFGVLVNPGQRTSKFVTYPEMVQLEMQRRKRVKDRSVNLTADAPASVANGPNADLFDRSLRCVFDTRKMAMRRLEPGEVAQAVLKRPPLPQIAQLELHLLLFHFPQVTSVFVRTVDRPRWRRMLGGSEKMTQMDVVVADGQPNREIFERIKKWSFMEEFKSDVHIEFTSTAPVKQEGDKLMCVYGPEDGQLLRSLVSFRGLTLADSLGFNDPILDENGRSLFERF